MRASSILVGKFQVSWASSSSCDGTHDAYDTVYKIPPLKANEGHRAQEWGDLAQPLWKGRIRIVERSSGVALQFEDATTGKCYMVLQSVSWADPCHSLGERAYCGTYTHSGS